MLNTAAVAVLKRPDIVKRMHDMGLTPVGDRPEEFAAFIKADIEKWRKLVQARGIRAAVSTPGGGRQQVRTKGKGDLRLVVTTLVPEETGMRKCPSMNEDPKKKLPARQPWRMPSA